MGIHSVQQLDDGHVKWVAEVRGETREWTTEITEQRPDEKIAWRTIDGEVKNDGTVTFERVGDEQTRISVEMERQGPSAAKCRTARRSELKLALRGGLSREVTLASVL